jgi:hypothetical protein
MRSPKKTVGAREGCRFHISEARSAALQRTESLVLRAVANETAFVTVLALRCPAPRCFGRFKSLT